MKVLVIGGGGREHALAWKIRQSRLVDELFCSPGNAGVAEIADCPPLASSDPDAVADFVARVGIDLTVVGPEIPLVAGLADRIRARGRAVFGPSARCARLEGSKAFSKEFMARHGIPTAGFEIFDSPEAALAHVERRPAPMVVKADGLAGGKGVFVCQTRDQAREAVHRLMIQRAFSGAGRVVIVEDLLVGREASFFAVTDGERCIPLVTCQDYKRVFDGDRGPNTGGMGCFSPSPHVKRELALKVVQEVVGPTIKGIAKEEEPYRGVLYVGLMLTDQGPKVLEFNVRFGDPETQTLMPRLASDLVPLLNAAAQGDLGNVRVEWKREASVCVVLTSQGYPGTIQKGRKITGIESFGGRQDLVLFHAGTRTGPGGETRTAGGRVLNVVATGQTVKEARERTYAAVDQINFPGMHFRKDIGADSPSSKSSTSSGAR